MSLQELFEMNIDGAPEENPNTSKWSISYQYKYANFDGYLDGDSDLSFDQVLWSGANEVRTNKNFPIVPTVIKQQAHLLSLHYQYNEAIGFLVTLPYIRQETDHISIIPDYDQFLIMTKGAGDSVLSVNYKFVDGVTHNWWASVGVSLPSGSIDEVGDTPREPGDQQLPYTMQLGSGTFDFPLELNYQHTGEHDFNVIISAMIRSGSNDRNYRLGNNYRLSGRYKFSLSKNAQWFVGSEFQYRSAIHGRDESLLLDGAFPYPAGITNPRLYGGRKFSLKTGLNWQFNKRSRLSIEFSKPVYQHLNGPQPKETWRSGIQLRTAL